MSQPFWSSTLQILFMLLVAGALGLWLGYLLWHKWRRLHEEVRADRDTAMSQNDILRRDLSVLRSQLADCERSRDLAASVTPDDLKVIEGIGPKIEKLCNAIGIHSWQQLALTTVERLQIMLADAGPDYKVSVPTTWPRQAELAASGEWEALKEYQDILKGGREV